MTCKYSLYYTDEMFYFPNIFQFAECILIINEISAWCLVKFIHTVNK